MIDMRQWIRQRSSRRLFVLLGVLALLLGGLPRWQTHDHGSHDWSVHHAHDAPNSDAFGAPDEPAGASDGLHIHELAAAFCGLVPDETSRVLERRRVAFSRPVPFAPPPDDHTSPLIRPPIA